MRKLLPALLLLALTTSCDSRFEVTRRQPAEFRREPRAEWLAPDPSEVVVRAGHNARVWKTPAALDQLSPDQTGDADEMACVAYTLYQWARSAGRTVSTPSVDELNGLDRNEWQGSRFERVAGQIKSVEWMRIPNDRVAEWVYETGPVGVGLASVFELLASTTEWQYRPELYGWATAPRSVLQTQRPNHAVLASGVDFDAECPNHNDRGAILLLYHYGTEFGARGHVWMCLADFNALMSHPGARAVTGKIK